MTWTDVLWLVVLIPVAFIQNMVFTAVSRSRNSGDPHYHRWWAYASNGIWLVCQFFIWKHFWAAFSEADYLAMACMAVIYTISTAEGSVFMMREMLKQESGARKVGADQKREEEFAVMKKELGELNNIMARFKARMDGAGL
jgi:hypothetical protein